MRKVTVNLTNDIKVMSTPVSQYQWTREMGVNPSYFDSGEDSVVVDVKGSSIKMQPDNPVEQITWWSALVFANKLSKKHNLMPAYDFSDITWEQGTLG